MNKKLKVKEVDVRGDRYVVCLNEEEAKKNMAPRDSMVKALKEKLARGPK